jgi:hypothetical protein
MLIGEESGYSLVPSPTRTGRANDYFLDDFFTFATWVVSILRLGFLGRLVNHDDVGP